MSAYHIKPMPSGGTDALLYIIESGPHVYVLKVQRPVTSYDSFSNDTRMLNWLNGKLPVPEIIFMEEHSGMEYLCTTKLNGKTLQEYIGLWPNDYVVMRYAEALRMLHAVPLDSKAPFWSPSDRVSAAMENAILGRVDVEDLQPEYGSVPLKELVSRLVGSLPTTMDPVFTHGDYCMDNLLFDGKLFSGFIDIGRGGRADRYQDIAIAIRSVREAFGEEMLDLFLLHYGLGRLDQQKMEFFTLLDEFY